MFCHVLQLRRLHERADEVNVDWKPMRGEMYKKYFIHPENPVWAWCDMVRGSDCAQDFEHSCLGEGISLICANIHDL